jgi:DNA-binding GntR family transcriptional regulator
VVEAPFVGETRTAEVARGARATEIFSALKRRILLWEYLPSHRFTEEDLCREFSVSRSPVREALRMLEESHLVDRTPYRGCMVKQPNLQEINELYDVRLLLELDVVERLVRQGIQQAVSEQLFALWDGLAQIGSTDQIDGAALADHDRAFHEALAQATGHRTIVDMLRSINDRLHFIRMTDITTVERLRETCRQHRLILEQLIAGDVIGASEAIRRNIEGARAHVEGALKDAIARAYLGDTVQRTVGGW